MCKVIDDLLEEREAIVRRNEKEEFAKRLHADGIDDERIARYTDTPVEQVRAWFR